MIGRIFPPKLAEEPKPKGFDDFEVRLGDRMRGERATLGKSLLDVQRELKIKATYIAAIENADPTAFDTPGFIAGYVRSYARYLALDPEWAYQTFCEESNFAVAHGMSAQASTVQTQRTEGAATAGGSKDPFANPNTPFIPSSDRFLSRVEPAAIGSVLVLLLLIGGIGYGGWTVLQEVQRVQFAPIEQAPGVTASIDPLAPSADVVASLDATLDSGPATDPDGGVASVAPSADALDRLYRPQALDVPVLVARDGPIAALNPENGSLLTQKDTPAAPGAGAPEFATAAATGSQLTPEMIASIAGTAPKVVEDTAAPVRIFATRPAWVQVKSASGSVIFEKILEAGEDYVLPKTEEPPVLRTGYAGAVYFSVNGQTYGPAGKGASVVKNIALAADELSTNYALADLKQHPELAKVVAELTGQ